MKNGQFQLLLFSLLLLTQNSLYGETSSGSSADATPLDLQEYTADWRTLEATNVRATLDSRGRVTVHTGGAQLVFGLEGQATGGFWQEAGARDLPNTGVEISGITLNGLAVTQAVTIADDSVTCAYRAGKPFQIVGSFPKKPQANWFRAEASEGDTVQGELWGTFKDLQLHGSLEYTYGQRRIRLAFGPREPLTLQPCRDFSRPATFRLKAHADDGSYLATLIVDSLSPVDAPLAPSDTPVVTSPFDRNKLITGPLTAFLTAGFHPSAKAALPPPQPRFVPKKGNPAIFKQREPLAFVTHWTVGGQTEADTLTLRCVNAMTDTTVESRTLEVQPGVTFEFRLQPVEPGPYRIELLRGAERIGEEEFVVVGPIPQRKIMPGSSEVFRLREVDRIECAADEGKHEFYCVSPDYVNIGEAPGVEPFLEDTAPHVTSFDPPGLEWMGYRINGLTPDRPHLLTVEYPDIDDMVVAVETLHPFVPPDVPLDEYGKRIITPEAVFAYNGDTAFKQLISMTTGYISGLGLPLTHKTRTLRAVFYPADDWALVHFTNYLRAQKPMRVTRIVVSEILDDIPALDAGHLPNDRIFGHYDEWQRDPLKSFAGVAVMQGDMGIYGNPRYTEYYRWYYQAAERMVKYLRFRGENTWFVGAHRYGNSCYPSLVGRYSEAAGQKDSIALFARLFEENGLTLVLTSAYAPSYPLLMEDRFTDADVAAGADTAFQVMGNGQQPSGLMGRQPNPFHATVRGAMEELAAEMAGRYDDYPAVKGIMFIGGGNGIFQPSLKGPAPWAYAKPSFNLDDAYFMATYDDTTLRMFEEQTGIDVPVSGDRDPNRFAERKAYLLEHGREEWIDFRTRNMAETWEGLARAVKARSPRMDFYASDYWHNGEYAYAVDTAVNTLDMTRQIGAVCARMNEPRSYVYGYYFNEMHGYYITNMQWLNTNHVARMNAMNLDPSTTPLLEKADRVGAYLGRQFFEARGKKPAPGAPPWYTRGDSSCRYPLAGGRGSMLDYAVILSRCTPLYLSHCFVDWSVPQGHDAAFQEFSLAYRAIPLGSYQTIFREAYPGITVRGTSGPDSATKYFYVVNTAPEPRTVRVSAEGDLAERTRHFGAPLEQDGGAWRFELNSYALRVFEISDGHILGVEAE